MKGDFTRSTFKAEKHYNAVRMQQGRLQLDADWNEQVDIQNHINQSLTQDLIGDSGAAKTGGGFKIEGTDKDLTIAAGHIYVNGILCELEEPTTYTTQPDYPNPNPPLNNGSFLAYLDVWERHITAIEDQKILEPALKGLDTATRTKTIWQVKLISTPKNLSESKVEEWIKTWKSPDGGSLNQDSKGYLTAATADGVSPNEEKELVNPNKKNYRGSENQLYRVEIHTSGDMNTAKFKWSRNNGTTVSAIDSIKGNTINLVNIGRDDLQSFKVNQWVEILDEEQELKNEPGMLLRLQKAFNTQLDVIGNPVESQFSGKKKLKVRGWHDTDKNEIPVSADWFEIENGIYLKFELDKEATYKTGDYWLIPARAVTKDIDWDYGKSGERKKERSHGIQHHYSPLALVKCENEKFTEIKDYRQTFLPLKDALDKTGDIMTGDLEIQANLYVTGKLVNSEFIPSKVGIGTKTPFQQLIIDSTGKVGIGYNEANQTAGLAIKDNVGIGTFDPKQQLIIDSTGKVGIGYNEANQTAGLAIRDNVGIGTFDPKQQLVINSGKVAIGYNEANQTAGLAIKDNVGVGTFDPKQQLVINSGKVGIGYNEANQTAGLAIRDNLGIGTFDPKQQLVINSGKVGIGYNEANQTAGLAIKDNLGIGTFDPKQQLVINSGKVAIGYNEANQTAGLAIRDNLGIGTTQPNALLDIKTTTKDGAKTSFLIQNLESSLFAVRDNGKVGIGYNDSSQTATLAIKENVGIGTIKPNALLDIKTTTKDGVRTSFLIENPDKTLFAIKDDGKVGIDIDNPEQKLVINNGKVGIGYNDSTQTAALAIKENVGIGTTQPNALLDIKAATKDGQITSFLVQNPQSSLFAVRDNGKVAIGYNETNQTAGLAIKENVGIGTPTPNALLNIKTTTKDGTKTSFLVENSDSRLFGISDDGKVAIGYDELTQTAALAIKENVGIGTQIPIAKLDIKSATKGGMATSFLVRNADSNLFAIKDDGKVGIGIDNPEQKLVINNGKVGIGYNYSTQTAALAIKDNVGIGTPNPSALLEIQATTKNTAAISFLVQNPERSLFAIKNDGHIGIGLVTPEQKLVINDGKVSIGYNDSTQTAALAIQDSVGIGTIQPNALLDIKTATKDGIITSFLVQNPDSSLFAVKDDGKVGIGISQPKAKLEIQGVVPTFGTGQIKSDRANKITGIQTQFQQELRIGDTITVDTQPRIITNIDDDNSLTVNAAFDPDLPSNGTKFTYQSPILNLLDSVGKTQMIVTNGGNVSIGNAFPNTNAKLFLDGDLRVNGKLLQNSSRELKENITQLSSQEALQTLNSLEPVKFTYKDSSDAKIHVGFISEDVPDLLASSDKTSVSPVDIAAVLTKAVKDQQVTISLLVHALKEHQKQISTLVEKVRVLESINQ